VVPGELLVRYRGDAAPYRRLKLASGQDPEAALRSLRARGDVLYAGPNALYRPLAAVNDPLYRYQWNFRPDAPGSIHVEAAWQQLAGRGLTPGLGATVAVVDTGVAFEEYTGTGYDGKPRQFVQAPDFAATSFQDPYHALRGDAHANDEAAHGTHIAGTIAAGTDDGVGAAGIARGAALIPIATARIVNNDVQLPESAVADGIRWAADHGADVINMSFGGRRASQVIADAITYAREHGCLLVAAAGNDWEDHLVFPASLDAEVLPVSACGYDGRIAPYSTYGQGLALCAPGGNYAQDSDRNATPDGIMQQAFYFLDNPSTFRGVLYEGTSMATAHVSGVAALVAGTGVQGEAALRSVLLRSASIKGRHSAQYGWGRLDAGKAVAAALPATPPLRRARPTFMRVEAIQMLPRQTSAGYVPQIRVRVSDQDFQPVASARVTLSLRGKRPLGLVTGTTDATGIASLPMGVLTEAPGTLIRARLTSVTHPSYRLQRAFSAELSEEMQIPLR
jgi:serine protease